MQMIHEGKDVHKGTAAQMFGIPYDEVTDEQRSRGKTLNFALVYGLGNAALAKALGYDIDEPKYKEATPILNRLNIKPWDLPPVETVLARVNSDRERGIIQYYFSPDVRHAITCAGQAKADYFAQFPGIKSFLEDCKQVAQQRGYIKYWTGRRRHLKNPKRDAYKAPNSLIQGGCGDVIKIKMSEMSEFIKAQGAEIAGRTYLMLNVHDEVCFNIHKDDLHLLDELNGIMSDLPFRVPISAGKEWSRRAWGDKKEFDTVDDILKELSQE